MTDAPISRAAVETARLAVQRKRKCSWNCGPDYQGSAECSCKVVAEAALRAAALELTREARAKAFEEAANSAKQAHEAIDLQHKYGERHARCLGLFTAYRTTELSLRSRAAAERSASQEGGDLNTSLQRRASSESRAHIAQPGASPEVPGQAQAVDAGEVLRELEWINMGSSTNPPQWYQCPSCWMTRDPGHSPNCRLAAALRSDRVDELEAEVERLREDQSPSWAFKVQALRASLSREPTLSELLSLASTHTLTSEETQAQRESFGRHNVATGDPAFD